MKAGAAQTAASQASDGQVEMMQMGDESECNDGGKSDGGLEAAARHTHCAKLAHQPPCLLLPGARPAASGSSGLLPFNQSRCPPFDTVLLHAA